MMTHAVVETLSALSTWQWFAYALASVSSAYYIYGTIAALWRLKKPSRMSVSLEDTAITVLKPMSGLDPCVEQNLQTFAALSAHENFEVILCIASERDPAMSVARRFVQRYPQRFRISCGSVAHTLNAKIGQMALGIRLARNEFIWMSDANVETSNAFMHSLIKTWKECNTPSRRPTLVHAPLTAVYGEGLGGCLERSHLAGFQNASHEFCLLAGVHCVIGKNIFVKKEDLDLLGGLEAFGRYLGEDYVLGKRFAEAGVTRCSRVPTRNVIGSVKIREWFMRQMRWGVLRKNMEPLAFYSSELLVYTGIPMLMGLFGLIDWRYALGVVLLKTLLDGIAYWAHADELPPLSDLIIVPLKELLFVGAWVGAVLTRQIRWRDHVFKIGPDSIILARDFEPSKLARSVSQSIERVRHALSSQRIKRRRQSVRRAKHWRSSRRK